MNVLKAEIYHSLKFRSDDDIGTIMYVPGSNNVDYFR